jgi:hypothetical protein
VPTDDIYAAPSVSTSLVREQTEQAGWEAMAVYSASGVTVSSRPVETCYGL